jgi:hypothetical protein
LVNKSGDLHPLLHPGRRIGGGFSVGGMNRRSLDRSLSNPHPSAFALPVTSVIVTPKVLNGSLVQFLPKQFIEAADVDQGRIGTTLCKLRSVKNPLYSQMLHVNMEAVSQGRKTLEGAPIFQRRHDGLSIDGGLPIRTLSVR